MKLQSASRRRLKRMAFGVGAKDTAIAEGTIREKLQSLQAKGCLKILGTERSGTRLRIFMTKEIAGLIRNEPESTSLKLEEMDFFNVAENRLLILEREGNACFYCHRKIDKTNYVIEHVYRNVAAACMACNNREGKALAEDFVRELYRNGHLNETEFQNRLLVLEPL